MNSQKDEVLVVQYDYLYFYSFDEGGGCPHCHATSRNKRDKETGIRTCQNEACGGLYRIVMTGEEPTKEKKNTEEKVALDFSEDKDLPEVPPEEEIPKVRFSVWRKVGCPHCKNTIAHRKIPGRLCLCSNRECRKYYKIVSQEDD